MAGKLIVPPIVQAQNVNYDNAVVVQPSDDLAARYAWLSSSDRDGQMGILAENNRRLLLVGGSGIITDDLTFDVDFVDVISCGSARFTGTISQKSNAVIDINIVLNTVSTDTSTATECVNAAEIRAAIGYWDDSEGSRVAGSLDSGGVCYINYEGIIDLGADDNILYPSPAGGITIVGKGKTVTTIQGRLYANMTAADDTFSVEDITIDIAGNVAIPVSPATVNYGGVILEDGSFVLRRTRITNGDTSDGGNNLTIVEDDNVTLCRIYSCEIDSVPDGSDCVSTKAPATASSGSGLYIYDSYIHDPGSGSSDQCLTPHEGFPAYAYNCWLSNPTGSAFVAADGSPCGLYRCYVEGQISSITELIGNHITCYDIDNGAQIVSLSTANGNAYAIGNYIESNMPADSDNRHFIKRFTATTGDTFIVSNYLHNTIEGGGVGVTIDVGSSGNDEFINNNRFDGLLRGVDARSTNADSLVEIKNNIINVTSYTIMGLVPQVTSANNILEDSVLTNNHTLAATDINAVAELHLDGVPRKYSNCDGTGDATAEIASAVGYDEDIVGNHRKWKSTICKGPIEIPQGDTHYSRGGIGS